MLLITKELNEKLLANGARRYDEDNDPEPVMKLFHPEGAATWIITERDPEQPDLLYGLCDLGLGFPELGDVSLDEISSVRGPLLGLGIERDLLFTARGTISAYVEAARSAQKIVELLVADSTTPAS